MVASAGPWEHTDSTPQGDGRGRRHRSLHCEAAAAAGPAMSTSTSMVSWCSGTWLGAHSAVCTPMLSNVRRPGPQGGSNEGIGDPGTEPARDEPPAAVWGSRPGSRRSSDGGTLTYLGVTVIGEGAGPPVLRGGRAAPAPAGGHHLHISIRQKRRGLTRAHVTSFLNQHSLFEAPRWALRLAEHGAPRFRAPVDVAPPSAPAARPGPALGARRERCRGTRRAAQKRKRPEAFVKVIRSVAK